MAEPLPHQRHKVNIPVTDGGAGAAPPPDAPRQIAQPLSPQLIAEQLAAAQANERELAPFAPKQTARTPEQQAAAEAAMAEAKQRQQERQARAARPSVDVPAASVVKSDELHDVQPRVRFNRSGHPVGIILTDESTGESAAAPARVEATRLPGGFNAAELFRDAVVEAVRTGADPVAALSAVIERQAAVETAAALAAIEASTAAPPPPPIPTEEIEVGGVKYEVPAAPILPPAELDDLRKTHPAASNTNTPARGIPAPITDPGKKITGGFGHGGLDQYYPLNGYEAGKQAIALCEQLIARIKNDLRLSMAATYPRLEMRLELTVQGYPLDNAFEIPIIAKPQKPETPVSLARQLADECVFVVVEEMIEMEGNPPNAVRAKLGLPVPRKQYVSLGKNAQGREQRMAVDRE